MTVVEVFSVCGIHPTEGELAYSAYQCFASRESADTWRKAQGPPHWPYSEIVSHTVEACQLSQASKIGELVCWSTFGKTCCGYLREWDNGTAIIRMDMNTFAVRAS